MSKKMSESAMVSIAMAFQYQMLTQKSMRFVFDQIRFDVLGDEIVSLGHPDSWQEDIMRMLTDESNKMEEE